MLGRLLLLLGVGAAILSAPLVHAEPARPLRFVTFNLLHGGPTTGWTGARDLEARLRATVDELRALAPDVIAFQEASVTWSHGNVAARIARELGMHYVHGPATGRIFPFGLLNRLIVLLIGFNEGPAILSRFPIVDSEVYDLPRCVKYLDPRVVLRAELATPWGSIQAFSTHASRDDCHPRRIGEIVGGFRDSAPAVLMGDFNAAQSSAGIEQLLGEARLVDAFRVTNPDADGPTVWQRIEAPEPTVFRRVDYVFVGFPNGVGSRVVQSRVVLNAPARLPDGRTLWPSDHYGVLGDIRLFGSAGPPRSRPGPRPAGRSTR